MTSGAAGGTMRPAMNERAYKVVGIGEALWDVFPDREAFGGAPANFVCHCCAMGAEAYLISSVGDDERGKAACSFLGRHGVDTSGLAVQADYDTGSVEVTLDGEGKPDYEIKENVAWDNIPFTDAVRSICSTADAVCFGTLGQRGEVSRRTIRRCIESASESCIRVFDINLRQHYYSAGVILESLGMSDVLKINDDELPVLSGMLGIAGGMEDQLRAILEKCNLKLAVLTCGAKGAFMVTPDASSFAVPPPTKVVDTVGAGDSFTAAMIMGKLRGEPLDEINKRANAIAAYVCSHRGAVPDLP